MFTASLSAELQLFHAESVKSRVQRASCWLRAIPKPTCTYSELLLDPDQSEPAGSPFPLLTSDLTCMLSEEPAGLCTASPS